MKISCGAQELQRGPWSCADDVPRQSLSRQEEHQRALANANQTRRGLIEKKGTSKVQETRPLEGILGREAIWQQIIDKINSVAEVRRTVIECKKRWHDCKRRTKEKMAWNRKAALQTGGGSPAHQEALDHMEEMVAAVIPEEIVRGIQGQDSARLPGDNTHAG
ncbi:hypothetical protein NDU88_004624 [Pleurodeles waltl]|uniref:Myb/SANT-like DNA-binding domain-containing protein n=1 Tax=Pleurodeles waltl TaxID=8319 RepID=A0AAV7PD17_PLEWA|nr:hypothetical protein NDU88_004624 [Pleurodeles waltl]